MLKADPRTWDDGTRCNECCNGDRCDDPDHHDRRSCPYCYGTGWAIWTEKGRADMIARGYGTEESIAAAQQSRICHLSWVRPGMSCHCGTPHAHLREPAWRTAGVMVDAPAQPLDMVLHCPKCHTQHVDEPDERTPGWVNPPHRSHLCHACGCIWRPADVATNGVRQVATRGKADTWPASVPERKRPASGAPLPLPPAGPTGAGGWCEMCGVTPHPAAGVGGTSNEQEKNRG